MIKVALRFGPFSHVPGTFCLLPRSCWQVQVFPTLLLFTNLHNFSAFDVLLPLHGPLKGFTVEQDAEKGCIRVFGEGRDGYMRYVIERTEKGIGISFEKKIAGLEDLFFPFAPELPQNICEERLSLGVHKAQDVDLIRRRANFEEIFPFWLRAAALLPPQPQEKRGVGTYLLLKECEELVAEQKKLEILPAFHRLFLAGLRGIFVPRLIDEEHQGLLEEIPVPEDLLPLPLLSQSGALIRSLFFQESGNTVRLLPVLPPAFHAGRFTGIARTNGDTLDLEWSKKLLRRATYHSTTDQTLTLELQKELKRFRLRHSLREKGKVIPAGTPLTLRAGDHLLLDRFEK